MSADRASTLVFVDIKITCRINYRLQLQNLPFSQLAVILMASEEERHELFVALLGAVDADDLEVQQRILTEHPELLKMSDMEGRTALHRAAGRGMALSLTHLISVSPDLGIANVSPRHRFFDGCALVTTCL